MDHIIRFKGPDAIFDEYFTPSRGYAGTDYDFCCLWTAVSTGLQVRLPNRSPMTAIAVPVGMKARLIGYNDLVARLIELLYRLL